MQNPGRLRAKAIAAACFLILCAVSLAYCADEKEHKTSTPIKHVVVIFQENVSFDHYFATYPHATNPLGEPRFVARRGTPTVNGLFRRSPDQQSQSGKPVPLGPRARGHLRPGP